MTITADIVELAEVTRKSEPSASGYYRNVWFLGDDLVVKCDKHNGSVCATEYQNYLSFEDFDFKIEDEVFHVRFPETAMVGNYLVMQRIKHEFLKDMWSKQCPDKPKGAYMCDYSDHHDNHRSGILERAIGNEVSKRFGLQDMHCENFMFDKETNTFWILDFAQ